MTVGQTPGRERIALFLATSGHSGVDRIVRNLIAEFAGAPFDFDLVTIRGHGPCIDRLPANFTAVRLRASHRNTVVPSLVRYLRRSRPAALLTASHRLNRAALVSRAVARVPTRMAIRMGMTLRGQEQQLGPRRSRRLFRSMRFWYPRADAVIAPSAGVGEDLVELAGVPRDRLHVIPNPLVTPELHRQAAEPVSHPWFTAGESPVILGAGSLEPRKDFATLVRAFARLRQQRPCRLAILGDGRERDMLRRLAGELDVAADLWLPGFVDNPYPYMARAAAFALTSRREGSGAVLIEALACGTPVVSTDCPTGPAETLQGGKLGPLVDMGDDAALNRALADLLDAPPSAEVLRAAADRFAASTAARRYLVALGVAEEAAS